MSSSPPGSPPAKKTKITAEDRNSDIEFVPQCEHEAKLLKFQEFDAEKEAENRRWEAEKEAMRQEFEATMEAQHQKSEAEKEAQHQKSEAEKEALRQEFEAKMEAQHQKSEAEKEALRQEFEATMEAKSLLSVLPNSNVLIPNLVPRGLPLSKSYPKKKKAKSEERDFLIPDIRNLDNRLKLKLGSSSSCLRALVDAQKGKLTYCNEFDVQAIIHNALCDAANICNTIIEKKLGYVNENTSFPNLLVRRESSIFSNIVDHAVVFDAVSGAPVFIVEAKKSWGQKSNPSGNVFGQVYDQLLEMHAKGHPNPFGALSCFDETYITWLDTKATQVVMDNLKKNVYGDERLEKIIRNFVVADDNKNSPPQMNISKGTSQTQSPVQEINIVSDTEMNEVTINSKGLFIPNTKLKVLRSNCLKPEHLVAAFVSAIFCSLDGFQAPRDIQKLTLKQHIQVDCLRMTIDKYVWGILQTTYKGPKKMEKGETTFPESLYLVDHLGTGNTSKVYRALTSDGYDCVVKMYIKRQDDDKKILEENVFNNIAKEAIDGEYKKYQEIYGDELKGYVWTQVLNGLHCLIHPYFRHIEKIQRDDLLYSEIPERLKLFATSNNQKIYTFHKSDQLWRHIGRFKDKLYIFDLGDLEEHDLKDEKMKTADYWIECHCDRLKARSRVEL